MSARQYLIAYDIPLDGRRTRLAKLLERYGDRVQYSVFMANLTPTQSIRLQVELEDIMRAGEDSILICDLGPSGRPARARCTWLGQQRLLTPQGTIII
ncbi:CRISPR-associated endonuclease Cas2 [Parenemella sanctibonifatiensis]|uniref:CRISPR-associated endoribonuclease Cas2 n=1 Tax=Parenemella sanctibonifatiensis TaxID=2016505 RepID=A0A255ETT9_9ACTN|nr:CRISPR-associated endonuclease Cas2 [Parenemella sanctibonifatiensis]OYN91533.1 CRISPR-associated endonuclease Cas2 [Parenemella sanctibonifatiensis]